MTEARLREIESLKRDELMRRAHEIVPEFIAEVESLNYRLENERQLVKRLQERIKKEPNDQ